MRRATVTITDELEAALDAFLCDQPAKPSMTAVMQAALDEFFTKRGYLPVELLNPTTDEDQARVFFARRGYPNVSIGQGPFDITPAPHGSGHTDTSIDHDRVFADEHI